MLNYTNHKKPTSLYKAGLTKRPFQLRCDYRGDGLGTKNKSLKFLEEDKNFISAWAGTSKHIYQTTGTKAPDVRWRAHMAIWAAKNGLNLEGDFVECGVHSGIFSNMICRYLDFGSTNKKFWLFDTWSGVPMEGLSVEEKAVADGYNKAYHQKDIFEAVTEEFAQFKNCHLIRGELPKSLDDADIKKVSYLSIDLNNATYEKACIENLWPKLVPGALILLDDYNFKSCRLQQDMWDEFAASKNTMVASLPTGQGLIIKT